MSDENELDTSAGPFSSRLSPRSFDMPGGAASLPSSSGVVARLFVASRAVVVSPCLACLRASRAGFPPASPPCLLAIRSALSSYRLAPRSSDKWGGANTGCVSVLVRLGRRCLLLAVAWSWMWRGGFPLLVLLVAAVSMASVGGVIFVVPVACRGPSYRSGVSCSPLLLASPLVAVVGRHGLIVIWCCRRGSASSSWVSVVIVASSCLPSGVVVISVRPVLGIRCRSSH